MNWPMERMGDSETDPSISGNLIYDKIDIVDQWRKGRLDFSIYGAMARDRSYEKE